MGNILQVISAVVIVLLGISIINAIVSAPELYRKNYWISRNKPIALIKTVYDSGYYVILLLLVIGTFVCVYVGEGSWWTILQKIRSVFEDIIYKINGSNIY